MGPKAYETYIFQVFRNCNFLVPRCRHKTKSTDQVRFFFDKAHARHKASNQEGQGKPLRSLTSHRRVNDLRGAPRPAWLRALCQAFCWVKKKNNGRGCKILLNKAPVQGDYFLVFEWIETTPIYFETTLVDEAKRLKSLWNLPEGSCTPFKSLLLNIESFWIQ